jgi:6-phosphogluconate dehydrogenase
MGLRVCEYRNTRWTVQTALDLGVPVDGIAEGTFDRSLSGHAGLRAAARGAK